MHKALLLIKVALLLATFASAGATHATATAQQGLVSICGDFSFGSSPTGDDKKAIASTPLVTQVVITTHHYFPWQLLVLPETVATRPFARAPPSTPLV